MLLEVENFTANYGQHPSLSYVLHNSGLISNSSLVLGTTDFASNKILQILNNHQRPEVVPADDLESLAKCIIAHLNSGLSNRIDALAEAGPSYPP